MWSVIQSRRQSSRCLTRNAQARSNVREKCFRTQTGRFKSVSSEIPPRKCLPEIFNRSAYAQHFHEWKEKKGRKRRNQAEHVCMHDGGSGGGKEKQKERKKMEDCCKIASETTFSVE